MIDANLMCSYTLLIFLIRGKRKLYLLRRGKDELWCSTALLWLWLLWLCFPDKKDERNLQSFLLQLGLPSALCSAPHGIILLRLWYSSISFTLVLQASYKHSLKTQLESKERRDSFAPPEVRAVACQRVDCMRCRERPTFEMPCSLTLFGSWESLACLWSMVSVVWRSCSLEWCERQACASMMIQMLMQVFETYCEYFFELF